MQLQNPLWAFALKVYSHSEIEQCCLALQNDFGMNINRLLFAAWLATQHKSIDVALLRHSQADYWQKSMTHPLRALRYQLRELRRDESELSMLYDAMRNAELEAEKVELAYLYQLAENWPQVVMTSEVLIVENIETLASAKSVCIKTTQRELLASFGQQILLVG